MRGLVGLIERPSLDLFWEADLNAVSELLGKLTR
jgi:hypothetical protein